jgi:hypothetical protein
MLRRLRRRLTFANVCSALALFVALGTGGAYAANTIGSSDVIDNSLVSADVKNGTLTADDVANETLGTARIKNGSVLGDDVHDNSLSGNDIVESTLGQVPSAVSADSASTAGSANSANTANFATTAGSADKAALEGTEVLWRLNPSNGLVEKTKTASIDCPAGKKAIAGGGWGYSTVFSGTTNDDVAITDNKPTGYVYTTATNTGYAIPTGWTVTVRGVEDPWNAGLYAGVYVTCAKTDLP